MPASRGIVWLIAIVLCVAASTTCGLPVAREANGSQTAYLQYWEEWYDAPAVVYALDGLLIFSYATQENGAQFNEIMAIGPEDSYPLWTLSSSGPAPRNSTCFAFSDVIPNTLFVVGNNQAAPNVSAVESTSGNVLWTTSVALPTVSGGNLTASVDGRTVYVIAETVYREPMLTAFDSANGTVLFNTWDVGTPYFTAWCGENADVPCFGWISEKEKQTEVRFLHGRTGTPLEAVTLPPILQGATPVTVQEPGLVLLTKTGLLAAISTANFTFPWVRSVQGVTAMRPHSFRLAKETRSVVVLMYAEGVGAFSARTGQGLWRTSAAEICPIAPPAPGPALGLASAGAALGAFPSAVLDGSLLSFVANCSYGSGQNQVIVGALSAVKGDVFWWRFIFNSHISRFPLIPFGREYFIVTPTADSGALFYFYAANRTVNSFSNNLYLRASDVYATHSATSTTATNVSNVTAAVYFRNYGEEFIGASVSTG